MASFSCRISPRTSTVILRDRSPFATAIVTAAMLRTCAVRLPAIEFTESVSVRQTPDTSSTTACPPSMPSVPTSRATRVTSCVNTLICSIMRFTIIAERRNSPSSARPSISSGTVCDRSPFATAAMLRVTSIVGCSRSSMSSLTEVSIAPQAPDRRSHWTRWRVRPRLPTASPTRSSSVASRSLAETMSLNVSAILPAMPVRSPRRRTEKSPLRTAINASSNSVESTSVSRGPPNGAPTTVLPRGSIRAPRSRTRIRPASATGRRSRRRADSRNTFEGVASGAQHGFAGFFGRAISKSWITFQDLEKNPTPTSSLAPRIRDVARSKAPFRLRFLRP